MHARLWTIKFMLFFSLLLQGTMYPRGRRRSGFWFSLWKRRTFAQKWSTSLAVLEASSEAVGQRERRWPLYYCEFYHRRSPLRSHGKHFLRPGWWTMAIWNDEEYLVVNLTDKTDYARAEICKFNPCLCIINSSTGIIFFLTVRLMTSRTGKE